MSIRDFRVRVYVNRTDSPLTLVDDLTAGLVSMTYSTALHAGFKILKLRAVTTIDTAWLYLTRGSTEPGRHFFHIIVWEGHEVRWEGRIVNPGLSWTSDGVFLDLEAQGYWAACRDQIVQTTLDYTSGGSGPVAIDAIIKDMLNNECPDINSNQDNIEATAGTVELTLPDDKYAQDHIIESLAPLGDTSGNVYYAGVYEDAKFFWKKRVVGSVPDWEVRLADITLGKIIQPGHFLRNRATAHDGNVANRTAAANNASSQVRYPIRSQTVILAADTDATALAQARDRFITEHKDPQQASSFTIAGDPVQTDRQDRTFGKRGAIRAGDVLKIVDLIPASDSSPELDGVRTFYLGTTEFNALADTVKVTPDDPPTKLSLVVARSGVELTR